MGGDGEGDLVVPAVKVAGEAQDFWVAGKGPGEANRHQRRFGAGAGEAHVLGGGDHLQISSPHRTSSSWPAPKWVPVATAGDGFDDLRVVVAEQQGAVSAEVVDVAVAVDVPFFRAGCPGDVDRIRPMERVSCVTPPGKTCWAHS